MSNSRMSANGRRMKNQIEQSNSGIILNSPIPTSISTISRLIMRTLYASTVEK